MKTRFAAAVVCVFTFCFAGGAEAAPGDEVLGGKLYYTGGDVVVKVLPASAGYTSELGFYKGPDAGQRKLMIATNRQQGTIKTISAQELGSWGVKSGDELVFGIYVQNTRQTFLMGEGSRNPDGIAHAKVTIQSPTKATVGFEDLFGGGDRDYNDNMFEFAGGISSEQEPPPPANQPPDCSGARPSVTELWPPNHKLHTVTIEGVTDPEGDAFTIAIVSVFQDEPVKGPGSGNTAPDAVIDGATVKLRAERSGQGDTRVYNITFVATDAKGNKAPPTVVSVAVPKSKGAETPPKGPTEFDSTAK